MNGSVLLFSFIICVGLNSCARTDGKVGNNQISYGLSNIFNQYQRYSTIEAYLRWLSETFPKIVRIYSIGVTSEGRDIFSAFISSGGDDKKNAIFIEAGMHAREWIAPAVALYLIQQLVEGYENNSQLLKNLDWIIVPVSNPDGYEYTHTKDRFWRKNRNLVANNCKGADINRNFGYHWGEYGASSYPCDEVYRGETPFSERESSAVRDLGLANYGRIKVFLSLHSFGPFIFYPWSFQDELPDDWLNLDYLARKAADAIEAVNGTRYQIGSSSRIIYGASGGSADYMRGAQKINYSYTLELPGGGSTGFDPPPNEILAIASETFEGLKVFGMFASNNRER